MITKCSTRLGFLFLKLILLDPDLDFRDAYLLGAAKYATRTQMLSIHGHTGDLSIWVSRLRLWYVLVFTLDKPNWIGASSIPDLGFLSLLEQFCFHY